MGQQLDADQIAATADMFHRWRPDLRVHAETSGKNAIVRVGRFPLQRGELLDLLFDHMRIQRRPQRGNQKLALFRQLLLNLAKNDSRMFILVEDALFLGPDTLAELEAVTAADSGPSDGAALVVMGDESLGELLAAKPLARLKQRIRQRRKLDPCGVDELGGYLRHCFRQAGGDFDKVFADGAAERLHQLSGGILRVTNNLVESSLDAAAAAGDDVVSVELLSQVADEEFGLTGTFSQLPEISSERPEPRHGDEATAELVAVSLPDQQPEPSEAATLREPAKQADDIPELIQDTQPALAILDDTLPNREIAMDFPVPLVLGLEEELGATFVDNTPVWFRHDDTIGRVSRNRFKELVQSGSVGLESVVFDNTVTRVGQVRAGEWERPASESWHRRAFFRDRAPA